MLLEFDDNFVFKNSKNKNFRNMFIQYEICNYENYVLNFINTFDLYHVKTYYIFEREDLYFNNGGASRSLKKQELLLIKYILKDLKK